MATYYLWIFNPMCLYKEPVIEKAVHGVSLAEAKLELEKINEKAMGLYLKLFPWEFHQETFISESCMSFDPKLCKREWEIRDGVAAWRGPWDDCRENIGPGEEWHAMYTVPANMPRHRKPHKRCQYDYRAPDGELFSCTAPSLEICRARRDAWLAERAA